MTDSSETTLNGSSGGSDPAAENGDDLRDILQAILRTNESLLTQNRAIHQLLLTTNAACRRDTILSPSCWDHGVEHGDGGVGVGIGIGIPTDPFGPGSRISRRSLADQLNNGQQTNTQIWEGILGVSAVDSDEFMNAFFHWSRPATIQEVLSERRRWTSWSYAAAFPQLSKFLKRATLNRAFHCRLWMDDLYAMHQSPRSVSYTETRKSANLLWDQIKDRDAFPGLSAESPSDARFSVRLYQIVDLSPLVLVSILGSAPQLDLSYMAAFMERHLNFSNWGKVSLLKFGDMSWSSYTLEYHFSFYYVTTEYSETESKRLDPRNCRKSAPFGREMAAKTRYIHEETLSFLLIGHFKDVTTCIQLAESYFKFDPYKKNTQSGTFRPYNLTQPPALLLLSWISVGLHHVLWRWQSAIEAVENEIKSSAQVVFMEDRSDLMADDPQFSLSKTYFWALQAYKLFEQTLLETIGAWKKFRLESLPKLREPRISPEEWNMSIQDIDDEIGELEAKVARIRKRIDEVKDLRTGLISASALFDSRTGVRQGENIRILTYVNMLFLPLSFATSIFGMQIIGESKKVVNAFAIALPAITLGTALLVFNLEHILNMWTSVTEGCTVWLRQRMRQHRRKDWKDRAIALHEDIAVARAPVRKVRRQSSGWVYLLFLLEYILVAFPVREIAACLNSAGLVEKDQESPGRRSSHQRRSSVQVENGGGGGPSGEANSVGTGTGVGASRQEEIKERIKQRIDQSIENEKKRQEQLKYEERGNVIAALLKLRRYTGRALVKMVTVLVAILRAIFMPLWIIVVLIDYLALVTWLACLSLRRDATTGSGPVTGTDTPSPTSAWLRAWKILGLDTFIPLERPPVDNTEFSTRAVTRVATRLGDIVPTRASPLVRQQDHRPTFPPPLPPLPSTTYRPQPHPQPHHHHPIPNPIPRRAQHAEDFLRVPTYTSAASRRARRARRFAHSGVDTQMELDDMDDVLPPAVMGHH